MTGGPYPEWFQLTQHGFIRGQFETREALQRFIIDNALEPFTHATEVISDRPFPKGAISSAELLHQIKEGIAAPSVPPPEWAKRQYPGLEPRRPRDGDIPDWLKAIPLARPISWQPWEAIARAGGRFVVLRYGFFLLDFADIEFVSVRLNETTSRFAEAAAYSDRAMAERVAAVWNERAKP